VIKFPSTSSFQARENAMVFPIRNKIAIQEVKEGEDGRRR